MSPEMFLRNFELLADTPNAVAKLREIVLHFAVQGKLIPQDPEDEPACELLRKLKVFKSNNPLRGRGGRAKEMPQRPVTTGPIAPNWARTTIGEILHVIRGSSPRPKGDPLYFSQNRTPYHWVKISDIRRHGQNGLLMDTDEFLTEAGMLKSVLLPKGTLVLTNSATIGVPIVLGIDGCCIHDGYLAFPQFPHALLDQKFFLYLLHTLKEHAENSARGLAQLNLNTDLVRSFPFGLPPLAEQKRIVAKVDELMALCDRLEAQQKEREEKHASLARASLARFAQAPTPANLSFLFHPINRHDKPNRLHPRPVQIPRHHQIQRHQHRPISMRKRMQQGRHRQRHVTAKPPWGTAHQGNSNRSPDTPVGPRNRPGYSPLALCSARSFVLPATQYAGAMLTAAAK